MGTDYVLKYKDIRLANIGRAHLYDDPRTNGLPDPDWDALSESSIVEDLYAIAAHHPTFAEFEEMKANILELLADFAESCQRAGRLSVLRNLLGEKDITVEKG
jgi:hypothetical protein